MKFTKEDFKKKYKANKSKIKAKSKTKAKAKGNEEEVDESLYGLEGGKKHYTHNEIQTDTQEIPGDTSSDFETDIPQTPEDFAAISKNTGADAMRGGNMGIRYGNAVHEAEELDEASKKRMKAMVQELLKQRTEENDFVQPENNVPDINQIKDITLKTKTNNLLKSFESADPNEVQIVINYLNSKVK